MLKFKTFHAQKGGVGKTTITLNYAITLSKINKRVLIIDLDPQGSISSVLGGDDLSVNANSSFWLTKLNTENNRKTLIKTIQPSVFKGISYVSSSLALTQTKRNLSQESNRSFVLFNNIALIHDYLSEHFDYVLFDSQPSYDDVTINVYHAAVDGIILINEPSIFSLETMMIALKDWENIIIQEKLQNNITGILLNKVSSSKISKDIFELLADNYSHLLLKTIIPTSSIIEKAFLIQKWPIDNKKLNSWIKPRWLRTEVIIPSTENKKQLLKLNQIGKKIPNGNPFINLYEELEGEKYGTKFN